MSNIKSTKDGLVEISSGKKIVSPLDMIQVYTSGKCYCPSQKQEIDLNACAGCSSYKGHSINNHDEAKPVFYVICSFSLK